MIFIKKNEFWRNFDKRYWWIWCIPEEDLLLDMFTIYKCRISYVNFSFPACDTRLQVRKKALDNKSKNLEEYYKVNIP